MQLVELRVARSKFAEALATMREWIDKNGGDPVKFESLTDSSGHIRVRVEFLLDDVGFAFQRYWQSATAGDEAKRPVGMIPLISEAPFAFI